MNPQPPPPEQVEEANRQKKIKKQSEPGDPESQISLAIDSAHNGCQSCTVASLTPRRHS